MKYKHIQATMMPMALNIIRKKGELEFVKSILERLEIVGDSMDRDEIPDNKLLKKLERDFVVYSRILPFKLLDKYPEHGAAKITSILDDNYDNFMTLFVDTYIFCVTGDILEIDEELRRKLSTYHK